MLLLLLTLPLTILTALLALLASGRLLRRTPRIGRPPAGAAAATPRQVDALEFQTRRANGTISGLGRLVERLEWDHLPMLWNIVRGDLRLVGVKPLHIHEAARIREEWERQRYTWSAGLTGLWYLKARHAALDETVIADVYWGATQNWRANLQLLAQTPAAWWKRIRQ